MPRIVFEGGCKAVKGFNSAPALGFDDAEVAMSIGDTVMLGNGFSI